MLALFIVLASTLQALAAPHLAPRATGVYIYAGRDGRCLSLPPGFQAGDGTPVVSVDCNSAGVSRWDINRGSGSIVLTGTKYAMDIGLGPGNNGPLKIWTSYPGAPQQTWYYTDDNRIAQTGGTQCLDEGTNGIQTYQCSPGNNNQVFFTRGGTPPPSSTSSAPPPPASSSSTPPPTGNNYIAAIAYTNLCLTTASQAFANGVEVWLSTCFATGDRLSQTQRWEVPLGGTGPVRLAGTNFCLDAGTNPANGSGMKIWQCYTGLLQQNWSVGFDGGLFRLSNNQCLDVRLESGAGGGPVIFRQKSMQTWTCSNGDSQQPYETEFRVSSVQ